MARRSSKGSKGGGGRGGSRSQSRKAAAAPAAAEVEVVEEESGMGIGDGLLIGTFLILVAATLVIDYARNAHYGEGTFF